MRFAPSYFVKTAMLRLSLLNPSLVDAMIAPAPKTVPPHVTSPVTEGIADIISLQGSKEEAPNNVVPLNTPVAVTASSTTHQFELTDGTQLSLTIS